MGDPSFDIEWQAAVASRIASGDVSAEREFAERFRRRILVMMLARVGRRDDAEELVHDTLMAVIVGVRKGQLREAASLGAFVHGVARNLANNHIRQVSAAPEFSEVHDDLQIAAPPAPDDDEQARLSLVRREIAQLEPVDRTILMRTLADGAKPGAIARELGLSAEVVRTRKSRAVKKLVARVMGLTRSASSIHSVNG